jgi:predicted membrane GTPase involved in stress response
MNFIDQQGISSQSQFSFRKNISTTMALVDLIDKIRSSVEKNEHCIGIVIDLAKAFDTVNHEILLKTLYHHGVRGIPFDWFRRYLNKRKQNVYLNNVQSNRLPAMCGVPQGSILGPLQLPTFLLS